MSNHPLLQCERLCKTYQEGNLHTDVLRNVSFCHATGRDDGDRRQLGVW